MADRHQRPKSYFMDEVGMWELNHSTGIARMLVSLFFPLPSSVVSMKDEGVPVITFSYGKVQKTDSSNTFLGTRQSFLDS